MRYAMKEGEGKNTVEKVAVKYPIFHNQKKQTFQKMWHKNLPVSTFE